MQVYILKGGEGVIFLKVSENRYVAYTYITPAVGYCLHACPSEFPRASILHHVSVKTEK